MLSHFALLAAALAFQAPGQDSVAAVDRIFAAYTNASPGCAVGVARAGRPIVSRAYGMANLEYDVPNTPNTIFEAGSVSKQFTAAAVVLLAMDGKLSLEDPIAKYFPELPDYGAPITIRQMLNHISGLRDWGTVVAAAGWPRGSRTYTQMHVLDVLAHQKALNFPPGSEYLYSNSNYNLAAMLVERVSGMSLPEFTRKRLFEPLGMTNTSWRDDYTRIVKNRSTAYAGGGGTFRQDMPFENVYGNSSLLTTVGDLLKWNENFVNPSAAFGGVRFVNEMQTRGRLTNGRTISYALGLSVDMYRGANVVSHTGATAGYRAYLARYPDQKLSVAVLCNVGSANPDVLGGRVSDVFLPTPSAFATQAAAPVPLSPAQVQSKAGTYRNLRTGEPLRFVALDSVLQTARTGRLRPVSANVFTVGPVRMEFSEDATTMRLVGSDGDTVGFVREVEWTPSAAALAEYAGTYSSEEAEAWFTVAVKDGKALMTDRYSRSVELTPHYKDGFVSPQGIVVVFRRGRFGSVNAASLGLGRVRDLRFAKK